MPKEVIEEYISNAYRRNEGNPNRFLSTSKHTVLDDSDLYKSLVQMFVYLAISPWYKALYMSKYKEVILTILSKSDIKSTNEVLTELQDKVHKVVNWHALYRILMDLQADNKVERLKSKAGFFWKKK